MIPHGVEVFVGLEAIDLRCGFERLPGVVADKLGHNARSGALFVFFGKRRSALKVVFFDGTGLCLFYKRLDAGTFQIPTAPDGAAMVMIEERVLEDLLDGIDLDAAVPRRDRLPIAGARHRDPFRIRRSDVSDTASPLDDSSTTQGRVVALEAALAAERELRAQLERKHGLPLGAYQAFEQQLEPMRRRLFIAKAAVR